MTHWIDVANLPRVMHCSPDEALKFFEGVGCRLRCLPFVGWQVELESLPQEIGQTVKASLALPPKNLLGYSAKGIGQTEPLLREAADGSVPVDRFEEGDEAKPISPNFDRFKELIGLQTDQNRSG